MAGTFIFLGIVGKCLPLIGSPRHANKKPIGGALGGVDSKKLSGDGTELEVSSGVWGDGASRFSPAPREINFGRGDRTASPTWRPEARDARTNGGFKKPTASRPSLTRDKSASETQRVTCQPPIKPTAANSPTVQALWRGL
ncbi:hypothetical protein JZ751_029694 [Albula glossodonta]|uniref:Uncharacterized protein n=1 Tax=Albula glossodonta TaxID=121402 RepID=A0A8T2NB91_9TELE|nr:hypothetical protein JZ751_029694 [Albula glossodonta]